MKSSMGCNALAFAMALGVLGCVLPAGSARVPSSHFVYPNSNVSALKTTKASSTNLCGILMFSWNGYGTKTTENVYKKAIRRGGGDILINASETRTTFMIPDLFQLCTTSVKGTAAKMEVGLQELR